MRSPRQDKHAFVTFVGMPQKILGVYGVSYVRFTSLNDVTPHLKWPGEDIAANTAPFSLVF